jgi:hypothetical protein
VQQKSVDETLIQVEQAQARLRDSIERARDLTAETQRLILGQRIETAKPPNPAS